MENKLKIDIITSILAINPKAEVTVIGEDINNIQWRNNTPVIDSATILAKQQELQTAADNAVAQQEANKQSALNKLKALGLTDAEITALIGS